MIPIVLHGDAVPVVACSRAAATSAMTWSVSSLLTSGPTILHHTVLAILFGSTSNSTSIEEVLLQLGWSFYFLQRGIHPTVDARNRPYPRGTKEHELAGPWDLNLTPSLLSCGSDVLFRIVVKPPPRTTSRRWMGRCAFYVYRRFRIHSRLSVAGEL